MILIFLSLVTIIISDNLEPVAPKRLNTRKSNLNRYIDLEIPVSRGSIAKELFATV